MVRVLSPLSLLFPSTTTTTTTYTTTYCNKSLLLPSWTSSFLSLPKWDQHQMDYSVYSTTTTHPYTQKIYNHHNHHLQQHYNNQIQKQKIVVIMGPTGSGKSRLSIDLATRYFPSEIINSDKIQVYNGLDITTNKIPMPDRRGIPHHLLGTVDPLSDFTPSDYRSAAASTISDVASRKNLPLVVGGSNSFIYALAANRFDPNTDVFSGLGADPVCSELRYDCCFIWVDVSLPVLNRYLRKRVDDMFDSGMFHELARYFESNEFYESESGVGLRKAIGVPEFDPYFRRVEVEDLRRRVMYDEAVREIKENTCELAKRQVGKILRLRNGGWEVKRVDATEAFREAMEVGGGGGGSDSTTGKASDIWEKQVVEPSVKIVKRFLEE